MINEAVDKMVVICLFFRLFFFNRNLLHLFNVSLF